MILPELVFWHRMIISFDLIVYISSYRELVSDTWFLGIRWIIFFYIWKHKTSNLCQGSYLTFTYASLLFTLSCSSVSMISHILRWKSWKVTIVVKHKERKRSFMLSRMLKLQLDSHVLITFFGCNKLMRLNFSNLQYMWWAKCILGTWSMANARVSNL